MEFCVESMHVELLGMRNMVSISITASCKGLSRTAMVVAQAQKNHDIIEPTAGTQEEYTPGQTYCRTMHSSRSACTKCLNAAPREAGCRNLTLLQKRQEIQV